MNLQDFKIAGVGEVLWDLYPEGKYPGGAPANFACHIARAGAHAILCSRVGDDEPGRQLKKELAQRHIDLACLQTDTEKKTGTVSVHLDASGQPSFTCSRDVAFDAMICDAAWRASAPQLHGLLFGTLAQRNRTSREAIGALLLNAAGAVKLFDVNLRGWNRATAEIVAAGLQLADILKLNQQEFEVLRHHMAPKSSDSAFIRHLLQTGAVKLIAVTRGGNGCLLGDANGLVEHPGFRVPVIDTTGCGDAFAAALMLGFLQRHSLAEMAESANRLGALVATRRGAVPHWQPEELEAVTALALVEEEPLGTA